MARNKQSSKYKNKVNRGMVAQQDEGYKKTMNEISANYDFYVEKQKIANKERKKLCKRKRKFANESKQKDNW